MTEAFLHLCDHVNANPVLLALLITGFTLFWEDGVVVFIAALVTSGEVNWIAAFFGLAFGIVIGDIALYLIGRFAAGFMLRRGWIGAERLERYEKRFNAHTAKTVYLARFIPGTRTITFLAVGILKAPFWRFTALAFSASVLQALLVAGAAHFLGETAKGVITNRYVKIALGAAVICAILLANLALSKRRKRRDEASAPPAAPTETPSAGCEFWPPFFFYLPTFFYVLWLALRHRSLRLATNANPAMFASGFAGESKIQVYGLLAASPACRAFLAPVVHIPARPGAAPGARLDDALAALDNAPFGFPLVAKPDIGQRGAGVRRVRDPGELRGYLARYPASEPLILQRLVTLPGEAAVLWQRFPGDPASGRVASFVTKDFPFVTGDGAHTTRQLILADSRFRRIAKMYGKKLAGTLDAVPPAGERVPLSFTGNHAQGSVFWDRARDVTPALTARFKALAESLDGVFYMRFDIRYNDYAALLRGEDFQIIELNGAGAEPVHMFDPGRTFREVCAILRWQYATLWQTGRQNLALGVNAMPSFRELLRGLQRARKLPQTYPPAE